MKPNFEGGIGLQQEMLRQEAKILTTQVHGPHNPNRQAFYKERLATVEDQLSGGILPESVKTEVRASASQVPNLQGEMWREYHDQAIFTDPEEGTPYGEEIK